jgi:hypothetical protein
MAIAVAKIRNFIEREEERLAIASVDRTRWIRLMADVARGDTEEAALEAHVRAHPEDAERINWVQWIVYSGVARAHGSVILGDRPPTADPAGVANQAAEKPGAPPATSSHDEVEKPTASPGPRHVADEPKPKPEPDLVETITPWGFGPRRAWNPFTDVCE